MGEYNLYLQHMGKLRDFCNETGLDFRFNGGGYPISLTLTPNGYYRQASLFDAARTSGDRDNALMTFVLCDGEISFSATEGATISDANFSKLKGLFDKISRYWTQYVFKRGALNPGLTLSDLWLDAEQEAHSV